ncbi:MAG: J domain-containing protein [Cyanobacteria bacterium P01_D01_bin.105]
MTNDASGKNSSGESASRHSSKHSVDSTDSSQPSYYDLMGLRPGASVQDIRRAYRDLSKLYHPDTTTLDSAIAIPKFQALNEAYATLSSPEKRLTYDYKIGFARMSVIHPLPEMGDTTIDSNGKKYSSSHAYLDPTDRPLSAGELFALFILGVTFAACLLLVVTLSLAQGEPPPASGPFT